MRNIRELIGIIKGVSFDGVVNKKEAMRLHSWVYKNRNLAYDHKQAELIKLVEHVLSDMIITEAEREEMLRFCDNYLHDFPDDNSLIYELNGIIEGIICDNDVNDSEIYKLKEWLYKHEDFIRNHKSSAELCKIIDSILSDGIITEEERQLILHHLSNRINSSIFETRLEYLKKQVRECQNIGIDLIDLLNNKFVVEEIHNRAETELKRTLQSYSGSYMSNWEIIFISLVLIALLHYDGNYYKSVRSTYENLYKYYSEQKIEGLIRTVLSRYRNDENISDNNSRIINAALYNAIVPSYFLKSFFEFIYDIYKLNFEYHLSDNLYEDFKFVYDGLKNSMLSDGDNVEINVTKKSYKLIKSTKQLIVNSKYMDTVIYLSIIVVKLIDKSVWGKEVRIFNSYLKHGYEEWAAALKEEKDKSYITASSELRSRWKPKYILTNNTIYIVPPIHRIKSEYNYYDIKAIVKNGDEIIYVNTAPDVREIIGGYEVNIDKIKIEKPLGKITYQLWVGDKIIYDSKDKLYRTFIVFDINGSEIQNNTDYFGMAVFCLNKEIFDFKILHRTCDFVLSEKSVKLGDAYIVENTVFNFSSLVKPGILGEKLNNHYISKEGKCDFITVYKSVEFLIFESENINGVFEIIIDNHSRMLQDFQHTITAREGVNKYIVNLDFIKSGVHSAEVYSIDEERRKKIFDFDFAVDDKLSAEVEKNDDYSYIVSISSGLFFAPIFTEIHVENFSEDWLKFQYNGKTYIYYIPLELNIYRLDNSCWIPMTEALWIGDIKHDSILDIYGTTAEEILIWTSNTGMPLEEPIKLRHNGIYCQVNIGFLVSYKSSGEYTRLLLCENGRATNNAGKINGLICYNQCVLNEEETELIYDPIIKKLNVIPSFWGNGKVFFVITNKCGEEIYRSSFLENGILESTEISSFENYKITFYEKEKGLSLKKDRMLKEYDRIFYAREDFVGRFFKVKEVSFDQYVKGEFLRKQHYFNKIFVRFTERVSEDIFVGKIYVKTYNGSFALNNINPVSIEICSDVIDESMELSITKDGDGLLLDFEHHGIMNTLDDDKAIDIFSYTIDVNGVKNFE